MTNRSLPFEECNEKLSPPSTLPCRVFEREREKETDLKWLTLVTTPASTKIDKVILPCCDGFLVLHVPVRRADSSGISHLLRTLREDETDINPDGSWCYFMGRLFFTYPDGAIGFLTAMAVAGFNDVSSRVAQCGFLQHKSVKIAIGLDVRATRFGNIFYTLPPCY